MKCLFGHKWEYLDSNIEHYSSFKTDWFSKYELMYNDTLKYYKDMHMKIISSPCRMCKKCHQKEIMIRKSHVVTMQQKYLKYSNGQYWLKISLSTEDRRDLTLNKLGI